MRKSNPCSPDEFDCGPEAQGEPYSVRAGNESAGMRLDKFLADALDTLSRSRIKTLINEGHVSCDGHIAGDPSGKVSSGETYDVNVPPATDPVPEAESIALNVIYEDDDLIVINKAAGMVVHPAPGNYSGTLVNALLHHCGSSLSGIGGVKRPGIVHRIDKDTSGLLVVAKTDAAHHGLSELFASHDITRAYLALVKGRPKPYSGRILPGRPSWGGPEGPFLEGAPRGKISLDVLIIVGCSITRIRSSCDKHAGYELFRHVRCR